MNVGGLRVLLDGLPADAPIVVSVDGTWHVVTDACLELDSDLNGYFVVVIGKN